MDTKRAPTTAAAAGAREHFVMFRLGAQTYALPLEPVVQIVEMVTITPIPQADPIVTGVITVHGTAVPAIDLRQQLGLPEIHLGLHTPIILTHVDGRLVGLLVDEVLDVLTLSHDQVRPLAEILPAPLHSLPLVRGLVSRAQDTVVLLDPQHLLVPVPPGTVPDELLSTAVAALARAGESAPAGGEPEAALETSA